MKHKLILLSAFFFLFACTPNKNKVVAVKVGDEYYAADASAAAALADENSDEKVICKRERKTGSRLGNQVCRTKKQIELDRAEDKRRISDNIQHNINRNVNTKGGG